MKSSIFLLGRKTFLFFKSTKTMEITLFSSPFSLNEILCVHFFLISSPDSTGERELNCLEKGDQKKIQNPNRFHARKLPSSLSSSRRTVAVAVNDLGFRRRCRHHRRHRRRYRCCHRRRYHHRRIRF